tara:strand:- start:111 stop:608 length:498 start_codon:yes stop_codon:yes gene_type:complete
MASNTQLRKDFTDMWNLGKDDYWKMSFGKNETYMLSHDTLEDIYFQLCDRKDITLKYTSTIVEANSEFNIGIQGHCIYKGPQWGIDGRKHIEREVITFGEAGPGNCKLKYYWAMAEKRCMDRAILKAIDAYRLFYSNVELDDKVNDPAKGAMDHIDKIKGDIDDK